MLRVAARRSMGNSWVKTLPKAALTAGNPNMLERKLWRVGVSDGDRTHDHWSHNPALYQLSYTHR